MTATVTTTASSAVPPLDSMRQSPHATPFSIFHFAVSAFSGSQISNFKFGFILLLALGLMLLALGRSRNPNSETRVPALSRLRISYILLPLFLTAIFLTSSSCGGGGNNGITNPGTPAGNYVLTVTAQNATVTQTVALDLKVN